MQPERCPIGRERIPGADRGRRRRRRWASLYGPLPRTFAAAKFLLIFSGRLDTDDRTADASFDFRVLDGQLAFRYAVSDGDVIVEVGATSISGRGSDGTFTCDLASLSCQ